MDEEIVSSLNDLPVFKAIKSYQLSDLQEMSKQQLIDVLPSDARITWTKPKILEEVEKVYNSAKKYFDEHELGLGRLQAGQLCLMGNELDLFREGQTVYLLTGLSWFPFPGNVGDSCKLLELNIKICNSHFDSIPFKLHSRYSNYGYRKEQVIYPVPKEYLIMNSEILEALKKALNILLAL